MGLSLVIVHFKTGDALARLIASLRDARPEPLGEIVIVNNSGEPIDEVIRGAPCPVRVVAPGQNVGYARGVNAGIRAIPDGDVLILNPDVRILPGSIEALAHALADHPKVGIAAPRLLNADGTLQLSARRFYNWKTLLLRRIPLGPFAAKNRTLREHVMADWDHASTRRVDWVIGAAMLVRRQAMRDVGLMDERYFLYFEDVDWCQRMGRHGYEVLYVPESQMVHEYERASAQLRPRSLQAHVAGLLRFTEKWSALVYALSQNRRRVTQAALLFTDIAAAALACVAAYGFRVALDPWFDKPVYPFTAYAGLFFFTIAVTIASLTGNGLYRQLAFRDGIDRAFRLGRAVLQAELLLMATTFLFQTPRYSRLLVLLVGPLLFGILFVGRSLLAGAEAGARRQGFAFRRVLLLGSGSDMESARAALEGARGSGFEPLHADTPYDGSESAEAAGARIRALVEAERIQIVCIVPEPAELPYLLALSSALRDSGAAVTWAGSLATFLPPSGRQRLGPIEAVLLHAPSRGLSLRARKRASDFFLSIVVAPWRWNGLRRHLARRGDSMAPARAWWQVWSGERSWVGRTEYERDRWAEVPAWARLALESVRPGVVSPAEEEGAGRAVRVAAELAYLSRFSLAEDLRIFLRATALVLLFVAAFAAVLGPRAAGAATKLFVRNHVNSNDVRGITSWNGMLAAATTGGLVTAAMPDGPLVKTLAAPGGLTTNRTLCLAESPSGDLWLGTVDQGVARLTRNGGWRRELTTFDGLPSDGVRVISRESDSVWVGTSGGVALFTENIQNARVTLRRSDTNTSTAGGLVSDDVRSLAVLGDTVWCGTASGLSAFAGGNWFDRRSLFAGAVNALLTVGDTLWIGTGAGPRAYAGGILAPVDGGHSGATLALVQAGAVYSGTDGSTVFRRTSGTWVATGPGLPTGLVDALGVAPDGALWAGTQSGLARYDAGASSWTPHVTQGPAIEALEKVAVRGSEAWFTPGNQTAPGLGAGEILRTDGTSWGFVTSLGTGGQLQASSVFAILAARDAHLWLGHCCSSVDPKPRVERFDPDSVTWLAPGGNNVLGFGESPSGRVYATSDRNGVYVYDSASGALLDSLTPTNTMGSASGTGLSNLDVRAARFDAAGIGWFGLTAAGVDRWDGRGTDDHADDHWSNYTTGFPSQSVRALAVLDTGTVYVGTLNGMAVLTHGVTDNARKNAINAVIGIVPVRDLANDPRGVVWIATSSGLARVDHRNGDVERFTSADGLVDNDLQGVAWDEARGILWVATAHGVSEVHPQSVGAPAFNDGAFIYPVPARPGATGLRISGLSGAVTGEIRDVTGTLVRRFHADPVSSSIWDLRDASGALAAPGIYMIVLRDGGRTRILRAAVTR